MNNLFRNRDLNLILKTRMLRCYIVLVILYSAKSLTKPEATLKCLKAFDVVLAYDAEIKLTNRKINFEVLAYMNKSKRHIQKNGILCIIFQGTIELKKRLLKKENILVEELMAMV